MKKKNSVSIFILIDALGWDYIKDRPFLDDIAVTKKPVKSILGFSSGVIPSILTGKYPQEHKHWSLYFYSPGTSPFRWTKPLLWLPKKVLNSRITRKIIEEISKRIMGYKGYFETYRIPVENLHLFDICENRNIYAAKGIRGSDSIFDIWHKKGIEYKSFTYPLRDKHIFTKAKESLNNSEGSYYFLYLSESDAILHRACRDKAQVEKMIAYYEKEIDELFRAAQKIFSKVNLFVFSDHGMAAVNKGFNLKEEIENLGFRIPKDYAVFYDSTMARFWFFNPKAKEAIINILRSKDYGRILSHEELKESGLGFEDNMYGEPIFLMNTGSVICPSFMGSRIPEGMHGFGVDDGIMDAMLVSNVEIKQEIKDVKDFYNLMSPSHHVTTSPEKQRIKVLYFLNSTVRAGVEEHVLRLIEKLDKTQFEPILVCPQQLIDLMEEDLEKIGVSYYPVHIRRWRNIKEIRKFLAILKQERPDIVHSHLFLATMFAAPLAKLAKVPIVLETAHIREAWRRGIKKAYFIDRFFYRFTDKIIAVSNAVKDYLITEKKAPAKKIEVIRNGVDVEKFKPANLGDSPLLGQSPRKGNGKFRVGVIGRLEPQKGHGYFLEAVKMLYADRRPWVTTSPGHHVTGSEMEFVIAGEGSLDESLKLKAKNLKIEDKVKFLGYRDDIKKVIANLDLIVLPSLYEGLPLTALEASAMAKPVVVTDVDGSPEAVVHNKTGLVVPAKDSTALKNAIEALFNNRGLLKEFGQKGRCHIEEYFRLDRQISNTETLYVNALDSTREE